MWELGENEIKIEKWSECIGRLGTVVTYRAKSATDLVEFPLGSMQVRHRVRGQAFLLWLRHSAADAITRKHTSAIEDHGQGPRVS